MGLPRSVAWPLLVVSSEKQSETLPHQLAWAKETAQQKGWMLERIGDFQGASTGKHGPRKIVRKLLVEIERLDPADRPEWVLMLRMDRVGRGSIVESQVVVHNLKQLGVKVWTRDQGEIKLESAMEQLMVAIASTVATQENEIKSEKATATHERKKRAGLHTGGVPYGFVNVENRLIPHEPEASFVRELFEKRLDGFGYAKLAKYAKREAPPKSAVHGPRDMLWTTGTMHRLLANARYRGPIAPTEIFDEVQKKAGTGVRREAMYDFPLRGAIRCSCGTMLSASMAGSSRHRVRYYLCRYSGHDNYPYHNAAHLEADFGRLLAQLVANPDVLKENVDAEALEQRLAVLKQMLAENDSRRVRAWELAEEAGLSSADLQQRIAELKADREPIEAEAQAVERELQSLASASRSRHTVLAHLSEMARTWSLSDPEAKRQIAQAVSDAFGGLFVKPAESARSGTIEVALI